MLIQILEFLFSAANDLSVAVSIVLAFTWVAALGCYIGKHVLASRPAAISRRASVAPVSSTVDLEPFGSDLVAKA
jgi:hypothetical protein